MWDEIDAIFCVARQEAHNALEGVSGTHLLGRRLVVEYAKEEVRGNE